MAKLFFRALIIAAISALVAYLFFQRQLRETLLSAASGRQVGYICEMIKEGKVSTEELCSQLVPEIPVFRDHYAKVKEQDGKWYDEHGLLYYPEVKCSGGDFVLSFMNKTFRCDKGSGAVSTQ